MLVINNCDNTRKMLRIDNVFSEEAPSEKSLSEESSNEESSSDESPTKRTSQVHIFSRTKI